MSNRNPAILITVNSGVAEVEYIPEGVETPVIVVEFDTLEPQVIYQGEECYILDVNSDGTFDLCWIGEDSAEYHANDVDQEDVEWL
jgi:hypothetical protein